MADTVPRRLHPHSVSVRDPTDLARNRGIPHSRASSDFFGNPPLADFELAADRARYPDRNDDHGLILLHYRIYADLWSSGAQARSGRQSARHHVRGLLKLDLAADLGNGVGSDRAAADFDRLHGARAPHCLSSLVLAGRRT